MGPGQAENLLAQYLQGLAIRHLIWQAIKLIRIVIPLGNGIEVDRLEMFNAVHYVWLCYFAGLIF